MSNKVFGRLILDISVECDGNSEDVVRKSSYLGSDMELTNKIELFDCRGQRIKLDEISGLVELKIHNVDAVWEAIVEGDMED